ncbi:hypothetical protein ACFZDK_34035 [Streptomyces sp. NPDC007901]|uniref:hypothetical protein n=1 Tax=Streptomyces sp. NPDC007901 TaxID=3364785 RepID=UPI0036E14072
MSRGSRHGGPSPGRGALAVDGGAFDVPRLARASVFAAVCVTTTALGHALMSGDTLPWWAITYAFAGTVSGAWWLTGRDRGAAVVIGATVVTQALLHLLFALAHQLAHAPVTMSPHSGMAMHHSGSMAMPSGSMRMPSGSPLASALPHLGSAGMVLAHLLAAVVCGLWLWRGETAAHRIASALAAVVFAPLRRVCCALFRAVPEPESPSCRPAAGGEQRRQPTAASLRFAVVRRGPPPSRSAVSRPSPDPLLAVGL